MAGLEFEGWSLPCFDCGCHRFLVYYARGLCKHDCRLFVPSVLRSTIDILAGVDIAGEDGHAATLLRDGVLHQLLLRPCLR